MAYTKQGFEDGKVLHAAELIAMEEGILANEENTAFRFKATATLKLGAEIFSASTSAQLGSGWSGNMADGFTHDSSDESGVLILSGDFKANTLYLLEFDTTYTAGEFVRVGFANDVKNLAYNGGSHIVMPLRCGTATNELHVVTEEKFAGTLSNFSVKEITEDGETERVIVLGSFQLADAENYGFWNVFISDTGLPKATGITRSIAIGHEALRSAEGGHRNVAIGTYALSHLKDGESNISIGADNMLSVEEADCCVSIGKGAMYDGSTRERDIAIGEDALRGVSTSNTQKNIAIGGQAGYKVTSAKQNVMIGVASGYNVTSGYCNTIIGDNSGKALTSGYFNTVIGRNANLPASGHHIVAIGDGATATKNNQAVIGADNITETLVKGNLVVRGTDGVMRQIVFNEDGTCTWTTV